MWICSFSRPSLYSSYHSLLIGYVSDITQYQPVWYSSEHKRNTDFLKWPVLSGIKSLTYWYVEIKHFQNLLGVIAAVFLSLILQMVHSNNSI